MSKVRAREQELALYRAANPGKGPPQIPPQVKKGRKSPGSRSGTRAFALALLKGYSKRTLSEKKGGN